MPAQLSDQAIDLLMNISIGGLKRKVAQMAPGLASAVGLDGPSLKEAYERSPAYRVPKPAITYPNSPYAPPTAREQARAEVAKQGDPAVEPSAVQPGDFLGGAVADGVKAAFSGARAAAPAAEDALFGNAAQRATQVSQYAEEHLADMKGEGWFHTHPSGMKQFVERAQPSNAAKAAETVGEFKQGAANQMTMPSGRLPQPMPATAKGRVEQLAQLKQRYDEIANRPLADDLAKVMKRRAP